MNILRIYWSIGGIQTRRGSWYIEIDFLCLIVKLCNYIDVVIISYINTQSVCINSAQSRWLDDFFVLIENNHCWIYIMVIIPIEIQGDWLEFIDKLQELQVELCLECAENEWMLTHRNRRFLSVVEADWRHRLVG